MNAATAPNKAVLASEDLATAIRLISNRRAKAGVAVRLGGPLLR